MKYLLKSILIFFVLYSKSAKTEVNMKIQNKINERSIIIIPFKLKGTDNFKQNIEKIITDDLRNSGQFNPVNYEIVSNKQLKIEEIKKKIWNKFNTNIIVFGEIKLIPDNRYIIDYQLVDILNYPGKILIKNKFKIEKKWFRYAAHNISNEIFERLINKKGDFCTRITYVSRKKIEKKFIYKLKISDYDGYNQYTVRISNEPIMSPRWSYDGKKIAYVLFKKNKTFLVEQTLKTGKIEKISEFEGHNGSPSFSPNGKKIIFSSSKSGSLNLYLMKFKDRKIYQLTNNNHNNTEANWMPDNKTILYTSDESGTPQIYKMNTKNKISERISWQEDKNQEVNINHNGDFILIVNSKNNKQRIGKINIKNGYFEFMTNSILDQSPTISPNGTMIIYSSVEKNEKTSLKLMSSNKKINILLPINKNEEIKFPSWSYLL